VKWLYDAKILANPYGSVKCRTSVSLKDAVAATRTPPATRILSRCLTFFLFTDFIACPFYYVCLSAGLTNYRANDPSILTAATDDAAINLSPVLRFAPLT
jgi:hypothetical protein